ncbi:heme-binding protein, partial [Hyphomicrobiales bacterium]|nr:heme-binding protein [Hyphomicrobiales bacterium]
YYVSMDGTYPASEEISRLKGKTSAGLPYTTAELSDMAFEGDSANNGILTLPGVVLLKGGVPIILDDGTHIGGVGVSGDSGGNDENCAKIASDIAKKLMAK